MNRLLAGGLVAGFAGAATLALVVPVSAQSPGDLIQLGATLDPIADLALSAGSAPLSLGLTGISSGAADEVQTLRVLATSSDPAILPPPTVVYTSPETVATLHLAPVAGTGGTVRITVTVFEDGSTVSGVRPK